MTAFIIVSFSVGSKQEGFLWCGQHTDGQLPPWPYQVFGAVMQTQGAEGTRALLKDQLEANSLRIVTLHLVLPFSTAGRRINTQQHNLRCFSTGLSSLSWYLGMLSKETHAKLPWRRTIKLSSGSFVYLTCWRFFSLSFSLCLFFFLPLFLFLIKYMKGLWSLTSHSLVPNSRSSKILKWWSVTHWVTEWLTLNDSLSNTQWPRLCLKLGSFGNIYKLYSKKKW